MFQPGQEGVRGEELAAGGCQFDGEWQAIQTDTDLRDGTSSGAGHLERRFRGLGALEKEGDGGRVGEDLRSVRCGAAGRTCSKLSSTSSRCLSIRKALSRSSRGRAPLSLMPSA